MTTTKQKRQQARFRKAAKSCKHKKGSYRACMRKKLRK